MGKSILIFVALFAFQSVNAQNTYPWPPSGNVGVGTTSPVSLFHVNGQLTAGNTAGGYHLVINDVNTARWAFGTGDHALHIANDYTNVWTERVLINHIGNVGIGTSNPTEKLDVQGTAKAITFLTGNLTYNTNDNFTYDGRTFGHYALSWGADSWDASPSAWFSGYGGIKFFTAGQVKMSIDVNGNVGIGTTDTKNYRFAVNGDAIFTKIKVKTFANWPDYVFRTSYRLRPLSDVEQYIQQHHHLPDVPSAEEVKKNGLDIGDNQATLLKKIEELTLYIIDLNKRVKDLEKQLKEK